MASQEILPPLHPAAGPDPRKGFSYYTDEMPETATKLALLGLTDDEIAAFFGVVRTTYDEWRILHQPFNEAINEGRTIADANVARALYSRATGEYVVTERVFTNKQTGAHQIIAVKQYVAPDTNAARLWLTNRQRGRWRDRHEVEHTGTVAAITPDQIEALTDDQRDQLRQIAAVLAGRDKSAE